MALRIYNLCLVLFSPVILLSYFIKLYKRPDYRDCWAERLGHFPSPKNTGGLHIHAVSLGEAKVAAKVVSELLTQHPELSVIFTCSTATASDFITKQFPDRVEHCYLPFDFPWIVAEFLNRYQPRYCVITEVEWWPNLICQHARKGNPIVIINAKMTEASAHTYQRFTSLFTTMSSKVHKVLVQNPSSYTLFQQLGLSNEQLLLTNNIKFDEAKPAATPAFIQQLSSEIQQRPVWVAGSTHEEDESEVLSAFQTLKAKHPQLLLILVPRHPERFERVNSKCEQSGYSVSRRSNNQPILENTDILLGDTLGELAGLYSLADMAFIGGSITDRGGHNPLEAAIYGIPLMMGSSQYNSADIVASLKSSGALMVTDTAEALSHTIDGWLIDKASRLAAGSACSQAFSDNHGALALTLQELNTLIDNPSSHKPQG